ncbi:proteasome accessory factor PafA2 family protein [Candidatus Nitronereus thalassa]|uniref:Proteasome accessory factor PafA2 family protein n=1 Tax=Candidatus Nitronereus thalassa TaxID=3020898 RepID=A0ABU3K404_9BACT|nr:proteasome accessory factor PafA2 family protein [Candidatus Nitronereus thalassa]MDT7041111.1 proteasome accessory factor PafA2 family protein [Candidatus Nitronereus thalassa]
MRLFGIETEYGIIREDQKQSDPVVESMELVRAYMSEQFEQTWDYKGEDPHEDQRGFRVHGLQQDVEEEQFAELDAHRPFSFYEMKSDLVLTNGARFYNDHTHPEYSTPECSTLSELIAHDRAGERIIQHAADTRNAILGSSAVQLYKNNTDLHGHSYGCHDNYLISRNLPFDQLCSGLIPFLVTRQIFAGAGKIGIEAQDQPYQPGVYQLSQRADFMETDLSVDTMHNRPILNTRDEPHANRQKYRRLHLIVGDANMCEFATALKVGTTQLVLELIEQGLAPEFQLSDPVKAIKTLSRDHDLKATIPLQSGKALTGLEIQTGYLEAAKHHFTEKDPDTDWILRNWEATLALLERNRLDLIGRIDWITKYWLLESFAQDEKLDWTDPWLASLDLEYHNVNTDRGLYLGIEQEGKAHRLCSENEIQTAMRQGPRTTRAGIRGLCVKKFRHEIQSVQWERIQLKSLTQPQQLDMSDLFDPAHITRLWQKIDNAKHLADVVSMPS